MKEYKKPAFEFLGLLSNDIITTSTVGEENCYTTFGIYGGKWL